MSRSVGPARFLAHRSALNAVAMLLALGLLSSGPATAGINADASAATLRELQRDLRQAREFSAALAKAVRDLVCETKTSPEAPILERSFAHAEGRRPQVRIEREPLIIQPVEYDARLMNLPPPAVR